MKNPRMFLIALSLFLCVSINAQIFVGGNLRFNSSKSEGDDGTPPLNETATYRFDLTPNAGKFLSEKLAAGIALNISLVGNKIEGTTETISRSSILGLSPFIRYYAIKRNKFSVYGQGTAGIEFSSSSTKNAGTTTEGPGTTRIHIDIFPGLSYDFSDKFALETSFNIFSLGYSYLITKDSPREDRSSNFNFGAGLDNIMTLGAITIGAKYKF